MPNAIENDDKNALNIIQEARAILGEQLATFCNLIDPELIVVGGEAVTFDEYLLEPMRAALKQHALWAPPPVEFDWDESNSWAKGAAALATQNCLIFKNQEVQTPREPNSQQNANSHHAPENLKA